MTERKYIHRGLTKAELREGFGAVMDDELDSISARRPEGAELRPDQEPMERGLVGLSFTGGGIRAATVDLGVVQALAEHGIMDQIDYLSSVSGGGYTAATLSTTLNSPEASARWGEKFPFYFEPGAEDSQAVKHLRHHSNYLAPNRSAGEKLQMPMLIYMGVFFNLLALLPFIMLGVYVTGLVWRDSYSLTGDWGYWLPTYIALGLLIPLNFLMILMGRFTGRTSWRSGWSRFHLATIAAVVAIFALQMMPVLVSVYARLLANPRGAMTTIWLFIAIGILPYVFANKALQRSEELMGRLALYMIGLAGPVIVLWMYVHASWWVIVKEGVPDGWLWVVDWMWLIAIGIIILNTLFLDFNRTSLHGFYRDRIAGAYMVGHEGEPRGDMTFAQMHDPKGHAPYHIINCTLNLQASKELNLLGRQADFFSITKDWMGSVTTGFCRTPDIVKVLPDFDLASATAISGAAVSPVMADKAEKRLTMFMAMLNLRIGYWLPNPRRFAQPTTPPSRASPEWWTKLRGLAWLPPHYLLYELFSLVDDKKSMVLLSDGGHIDNSGVYELLRRRCRYIIVIDGGQDNEMEFGTLAKLIRFARIDRGVEIKMNLNDLRTDADGLSRKSSAIGTIHYSDEEIGHLLWIKTTMTGSENEYIREYKATHPDFPHQPTSDQFFDEAKFENYRALGHHIAADLFHYGPLGVRDSRKEIDIQTWFEDLSDLLSPSYHREDLRQSDEVTGAILNEQLRELEAQHQQSWLAPYTFQIYPELVEAHDTPINDEDLDQEHRAAIFQHCRDQLSFMDTVVYALELDRHQNRDKAENRGWMNLFTRWAETRFFREAWAIAVGTYSRGLELFCEEDLRLRRHVRCAKIDLDGLTAREQYLVSQVAPDEGMERQVWQIRLMVQLTRGSHGFRGKLDEASADYLRIPFGVAVVDRDGGSARCRFVRIRHRYRGMRLLERLFDAMRHKLLDEGVDSDQMFVVLDRSRRDVWRSPHFFHKYGFRYIPEEVWASEVST